MIQALGLLLSVNSMYHVRKNDIGITTGQEVFIGK